MSISELAKKLRRVVIARGTRREDVEDIVQEAFARMESYMQAHEVRSKEAFLVSAAINIVTDETRRRHRSPITGDSLKIEHVADLAARPDEMLAIRDRLRCVGEGLERLDPQVKRILLAHRLEGATFPQIAARENLSVANVEKKVARAVLFLAKWVNER